MPDGHFEKPTIASCCFLFVGGLWNARVSSHFHENTQYEVNMCISILAAHVSNQLVNIPTLSRVHRQHGLVGTLLCPLVNVSTLQDLCQYVVSIWAPLVKLGLEDDWKQITDLVLKTTSRGIGLPAQDASIIHRILLSDPPLFIIFVQVCALVLFKRAHMSTVQNPVSDLCRPLKYWCFFKRNSSNGSGFQCLPQQLADSCRV